MDAITLLKNDHKTVERLFKRFEKSDDKTEKRQIVDEIIGELSVHAAIEEQVFYPSVRAGIPEEEDTVLEALEEHHVAKWVLSELEGLSPDAERFDAKVMVLIESVRHHVEEEESELFPEVRNALARKRLAEIGEALETAKTGAPRTPQPTLPDTPPENLLTSLAADALERARAAATAPRPAKKRGTKKAAAKKSTTKKAPAKTSAAKKAPAKKRR